MTTTQTVETPPDATKDAHSMQSLLDEAAAYANVSDELYRVLSVGLKRLRDFEKRDSDTDEGEDSKYVVAKYDAPTSYFKLPADMDKSFNVNVKWGTLHYRSKNGKFKSVEPSHTSGDSDQKRPSVMKFLKDKPWMWNGNPDEDSSDEDFDGGIVELFEG